VTVTVEDSVLVLLGGRSRSAYDLWHEHTRIFRTTWRVDIRRVMDAVAKLERSGLVHVEPATRARQTSGNRRACQLTAAGRRRQVEWLCGVTPDFGVEDMYIRGMLAVDAADPDTFEAFRTTSLTCVEKRIRNLGPTDTVDLVAGATAAFDREVTRALRRWLRALPRHRPSQPAAALETDEGQPSQGRG
jgi:DNA-binding PadR family transcriptional regulator